MSAARKPIRAAPRFGRPGWRPAGSTVFIALGLLSYLGLRQLPPDNSLAQVRSADVLKVCMPAQLPPYITASGDAVSGLEAGVLEQAAKSIGVPLGWNVQASWGTSADPVDWGVRPESCDVLAGGIVVNDETQALMQLLPYRRTHWVLFSRSAAAPSKLGVLSNHWGLNPEEVYDWADAKGLEFQSYEDAAQALSALNSGERDAVLTLDGEAQWLQKHLPGSRIQALGLPPHTLAIGMWKNNITLKRAMTAALPRP